MASKRYGAGEDPGQAAAMATAESAPLGAGLLQKSPLLAYFLVAVAGGLTVWYLTKWLDGRGRKSKKLGRFTESKRIKFVEEE